MTYQVKRMAFLIEVVDHEIHPDIFRVVCRYWNPGYQLVVIPFFSIQVYQRLRGRILRSPSRSLQSVSMVTSRKIGGFGANSCLSTKTALFSDNLIKHLLW